MNMHNVVYRGVMLA